MTHNPKWSLHILTRLQKAYNTFFFARRNVSGAISVKSKLDLCKSTFLSTLCYASPCWFASRGDTRKIEKLQVRVTNGVLPCKCNYRERLILLSLLPIPLYIQILDVLTLVKMCKGGYGIEPQFTFKFEKSSFCDCRISPHIEYPSTELQYQELFLRTSRLIKHLPAVDASQPMGLKPKLLSKFGTFLQENKLFKY